MNANLYAIDVRGPMASHFTRMHQTPSEHDALRIAHYWDNCGKRGWHVRVMTPSNLCIVSKEI